MSVAFIVFSPCLNTDCRGDRNNLIAINGFQNTIKSQFSQFSLTKPGSNLQNHSITLTVQTSVHIKFEIEFSLGHCVGLLKLN